MYCTKEQFINGCIAYVDNEVINKLPTSSKWIVGTAVLLISKNAKTLLNDDYLKLMGVVNNDGLIDIDSLLQALKETSSRYGNIQIANPLIGTMTFDSNDVDLIKRYIT